MFKTMLAALALFVAASAWAAPSQYDFQYTLEGGAVLSGSLMGELQSDNNTIVVSSILDFAKLNGVDGPSITSVLSWLFYYQGDDPAVSLDGTFMDMFALHASGTDGFWFLFRYVPGVVDEKVYGGRESFGGSPSNPYSEEFEPTRWQIQAANIPEPGTLALLGLGLAGLAATRRRKQ